MAKGEEKLRLVLSAIDKTAAPIRAVNKRISAMTKPIRKVKNALAKLGNEAGLHRLGAMFKGIGRAARRFAIAGVAALGAVGLAVVKVSEKGDEIAKFSRQIGIGSSALQEYEYAAERSGIATSTFRASVGALSKRVGELKTGKGALATILGGSKLAEQLKATKSTEEALALLNAAIAKVEDPTKKAALAAAAFSRAGLPMIRLANEGAEEISKLRDRARELGFVLSGDQLKASEEFQDSLTDLKGVLGGLVNQIAARLIPIFGPLVDKVTAFVLANRDLIETKAHEAIEAIVQGVTELGEWLSTTVPKVVAFIQSIGGLKTIAIALGVVLTLALLPALVAIGAAAVTVGGLIVTALSAVWVATGPVGLAIWGVAAIVVAVVVLIEKNMDAIKTAFGSAVDWIIEKGTNLVQKLPKPLADLILGGGSSSIEIAGGASMGAAAESAAAVANGPAAANVGGKISIELDDKRARVTSAETSQPDLELDLAGGETLSPA